MPPQPGQGQSQSGILQSLQNGVTAIRDIITGQSELVVATENISTAITASFPPLANPSTGAPPAGTVLYTSSLAAAFVFVTTSSGALYRLALYPSS